MKKVSLEEIKKFWIEAGKKDFDEQGLKPTARDPYLQMLNEFYILKSLEPNSSVIDIGCGDGTSSLKFAKRVKNLTGIDYSETLIERANEKCAPNTQFIFGDVLDIKSLFPLEYFDAIIIIRCLINLPDEKMQYQALEDIFCLLKPKGILFLSEGYQQGWDGLNIHRKCSNLKKMEIRGYNNFFDDQLLNNLLKRHGRIRDFIGFGEYLHGSRVVHPLLTNGDVKHDSHINKIFAEIQMNNSAKRNYRDCDYAGIYIVEKY
jgi:ubiquinone/menaquinone biosynthesis C-methylase UbiE